MPVRELQEMEAITQAQGQRQVAVAMAGPSPVAQLLTRQAMAVAEFWLRAALIRPASLDRAVFFRAAPAATLIRPAKESCRWAEVILVAATADKADRSSAGMAQLAAWDWLPTAAAVQVRELREFRQLAVPWL
jgi:hypothetical protein